MSIKQIKESLEKAPRIREVKIAIREVRRFEQTLIEAKEAVALYRAAEKAKFKEAEQANLKVAEEDIPQKPEPASSTTEPKADAPIKEASKKEDTNETKEKA